MQRHLKVWKWVIGFLFCFYGKDVFLLNIGSLLMVCATWLLDWLLVELMEKCFSGKRLINVFTYIPVSGISLFWVSILLKFEQFSVNAKDLFRNLANIS